MRLCVLVLLLATVANGQDPPRTILFHVSRVYHVTTVGPDGKRHPTTVATGWTKESTILVTYVMACAASSPHLLCDDLVQGQAYKADFEPAYGTGLGYGSFGFPVSHVIQEHDVMMPYTVILAEPQA